MGGFSGIGACRQFRFLEKVAPAFVVIRGALGILELFNSCFRLAFALKDPDHSRRPVGPDVMQDDGVGTAVVVRCQRESIRFRLDDERVKKGKGDLRGHRLFRFVGLREPERFPLASPWDPW